MLTVARLRPLADRGRRTRKKTPYPNAPKRSNWEREPLTFDDLATAAKRGRDKLARRPDLLADLERDGRVRALIYKSLVLTGLRKGELASLTVGHLDLDGPTAYAELKAADEKNREGSEVPIRADLAADLRQWLADRLVGEQAAARLRIGGAWPLQLPPTTRLFGIPYGLLRILDRDLAVAGIPKRDDRGRTVDVHAKRHTFGTHLRKGGVPLRTAQAAMRHSDPSLTANVYTDPKLLGVAGALDALPALPLDGGTTTWTQAATGTHGAFGNGEFDGHPAARTLVPAGGNPCVSMASADISDDGSNGVTGGFETAVSVGGGASKPPLTSAVSGGPQIGATRFELATSRPPAWGREGRIC